MYKVINKLIVMDKKKKKKKKNLLSHNTKHHFKNTTTITCSVWHSGRLPEQASANKLAT